MDHVECPFCQLAQSEQARIIERKHLVTVFLSNPRLMPGHTLITPNRHIEKPWQMTAEERKELFDTVLEYQQKIVAKFATGCDIREHYRPFIRQNRVKIDHIHFHLHPRELEDALYTKSQCGERDLWKDLDDQEAQDILKHLRA